MSYACGSPVGCRSRSRSGPQPDTAPRTRTPSTGWAVKPRRRGALGSASTASTRSPRAANAPQSPAATRVRPTPPRPRPSASCWPTTATTSGRPRVRLDRLQAALDDIRQLSARTKALDKRIPPLLDQLGCTLTEICGIGPVTAMDLLVEVGDPCRFTTEAQFARWCGSAPVALSSGEGHGPARRHRLDVGGNRNVNSILHIVHVTQVRCHEPARTYIARKIAELGVYPLLA
jgi:transposase